MVGALLKGYSLLVLLIVVAQVVGARFSPKFMRLLAWSTVPVLLLMVGRLRSDPSFLVDFKVFRTVGGDGLAGLDPYIGLHSREMAPVLNPPTALPLFILFALIPPGVVGWAWIAASVAGTFGLARLANAALKAQGGGLADEAPPDLVWGLTAALMLCVGSRLGVKGGQLHVLTGLLVLGALWLQGRGRPARSGVALALASIKPQSMVPFLILFARRRDRVAWATVAAGIVLLCLAATPHAELPRRLVENVREIAKANGPGGINDISYRNSYIEDMFGCGVLLARLGLRDRRLIEAIQCGLLGVVGAALLAEVVRDRISRGAQCSLVSCYSMMFLYHRVYDFPNLAVPLVYAAARARALRGRDRLLHGAAAIAILLAINIYGNVMNPILARSWGLGPVGWLYRALIYAYANWAIVAAMAAIWCGARRALAPEASEGPNGPLAIDPGG